MKKDLYRFNIAMLAKKCWRIIHAPRSVLARIFKSKYLPWEDFLDSNGKAFFQQERWLNRMSVLQRENVTP